MSGHNLGLAEGFEITYDIGDDVDYLIEQCIQKHMNKERTANHLLEKYQIEPEVTTTIWESLELENPDFFTWFGTQCDVVGELNEKLEEINQSGLTDMMKESTLSDGPSNHEIRSFLLEASADLTASTSSGTETVPRVPEVPKEDPSQLSSRANRVKEKNKKRKAKKKEKQLRNQVQLLLQAQEQLASSASPTTETALDGQRLSSSKAPEEEVTVDIEGDDDDTILEEISSTTRQLETIDMMRDSTLSDGPMAPAPEFTASSSSRPAIVPSVSALKLDSSELSTMAKKAKQMRNKKRKAKKKEKKLVNQVAEQQQQQATLDSSPATETAPEVQRLSSSTVSQKEDIIDIEGDDDDKILEEISRITRQLESIVKPVLKLLKNGAGPGRQKASGSRAKTFRKQPSRDQRNDEQQQSGVTGDNQETEKINAEKNHLRDKEIRLIQ